MLTSLDLFSGVAHHIIYFKCVRGLRLAAFDRKKAPEMAPQGTPFGSLINCAFCSPLRYRRFTGPPSHTFPPPHQYPRLTVRS